MLGGKSLQDKIPERRELHREKSPEIMQIWELFLFPLVRVENLLVHRAQLEYTEWFCLRREELLAII